MVLMKPTSVASTGSGNSSSIGTNGSVTFSACETLSLNGVFTADYDNYMVVIRYSCSAAGDNPLNFRLRDTGTDESGNNYTHQLLEANDSSVSAARTSSTSLGRMGRIDNAERGGQVLHVYGPYLAQPTAFRNVSGWGDNRISDSATTHSLSDNYDGITIFPATGTNDDISGLVSVYGLVGT
jgi:hypothetical protein